MNISSPRNAIGFLLKFKLPLRRICGRHLFESELCQRISVGDFVAAIAGIKNHEVLVHRRIQLVLFLDLFGLARIARIIHRADGNLRVDPRGTR